MTPPQDQESPLEEPFEFRATFNWGLGPVDAGIGYTPKPWKEALADAIFIHALTGDAEDCKESEK